MYVVIAGGGKVGAYLASVLLQSGNEVAVIEQDLRTADVLAMDLEGDYMVIHGDGCDYRYLQDAGIAKADVFVAATGQDDSNLVACEIAQSVSNVQRTIARVNNPKNNRIFRELGIESISATAQIANLIEEEALMGSMSVVTNLQRDGVTLIEVIVPKLSDRPKDAGIKLSEIQVPPSALIVAVNTRRGVSVASRDYVLRPGDKAIVMTENDSIDKVRAIFRNL